MQCLAASFRWLWLCNPATPNDLSHSVLAQPHLSPNQAVAAALRDERQHLGRQPVRLGPLSGLTSKSLAASLGGSNAGADALLSKLALELGDTGQKGCHHAPVRGGEIERHPVQCHQRHAPRLQLLKRCQ